MASHLRPSARRSPLPFSEYSVASLSFGSIPQLSNPSPPLVLPEECPSPHLEFVLVPHPSFSILPNPNPRPALSLSFSFPFSLLSPLSNAHANKLPRPSIATWGKFFQSLYPKPLHIRHSHSRALLQERDGNPQIRRGPLLSSSSSSSFKLFDDDDESHGVENTKRNQETAAKTAKHLFSGAVAAMVSRTFVAPLERLKLEYMVRGVNRNILETFRVIVMTEGIRGFWKGNIVNLMRTAPFKSINFFCYDVCRKQLLEITGQDELNNLERLAAGAAAGISATLLCFPIDTIRTRMVAPGGEALGGVICCMRHMVQNEGFSSLYKGLIPAVISMAPSGAIFYGVYDILKTSYLQSEEGKEDLRRRLEMERERTHKSRKVGGDLKEEAENLGQLELGPTRTLLYGAVAGACAEISIYPLEVIRRKLQMQNAATSMGALATCQQLLQKGGLSAFYSGLLPSSLQVLPSAALSYFVYEYMKVMLKVS